MLNTNQIAEIGLLVGEPSRAAILLALMDGQAFTATELARCANITPQTASSHLARLAQASLITVQKQGRHRYHRLASTEVARMLEGIMNLAASNERCTPKPFVGPRDEAMRLGRTCYDHFAGRLGVAIADGLIKQKFVEFDDEVGLVSDQGTTFFAKHGIKIPISSRSARPLCRPCMDWSERRPHIAGNLGAAICTHFLEKKYARRINDSRAVALTANGKTALQSIFGIRELN
jgi:DNA-binding transcriptional ArsR family regulator